MNHERDDLPEAVPIDPEAERRELEAAGWERFEKGTGEVVWWHPTSGTLYSQGAAIRGSGETRLARISWMKNQGGGRERAARTSATADKADTGAHRRRACREEWGGREHHK